MVDSEPDTTGDVQGRITSDRLMAALVDAGYSNTRPRQAVIAVIANASGYLNPAQILREARAIYPQIGLVTVYRTLDVLADLGLVRKVHLADGCHSYALTEKTHGHHVICAACRQVVEFEGCDLSAVFRRVERQTGYVVQDHWLEIFGLCPACRQKQHTQGG
jgi:Fe2+ or Zn2+ uptake regulation protein